MRELGVSSIAEVLKNLVLPFAESPILAMSIGSAQMNTVHPASGKSDGN
jgi:hypothetical protein